MIWSYHDSILTKVYLFARIRSNRQRWSERSGTAEIDGRLQQTGRESFTIHRFGPTWHESCRFWERATLLKKGDCFKSGQKLPQTKKIASFSRLIQIPETLGTIIRLRELKGFVKHLSVHGT